MPMHNGDITTTRTIEIKQVYKNLLYARATHSNHEIQYLMQQIMEQQKVVDEYSSIMKDERDSTPLELNLRKSDLAVISHIIHIIEVDNFWYQKTFEAVLADLWRNWDKEVYKQENRTLHCKENAKTHKEMDGKEVIDLCSESQTMTSEHCKAKHSKKQENHDREESKTITRKENENRPEKDFRAQKTEENK